MKIDGECHCGKITYEADVDPETVRICHCTDCQVLSGTAFRTVVATQDEDFSLLSGKPKTYIKTADSGAKRAQVFCPDCGTPLYATSVGDGPKVFGLPRRVHPSACRTAPHGTHLVALRARLVGRHGDAAQEGSANLAVNWPRQAGRGFPAT